MTRRPSPRLMTVLRAQQLTPHMRRVTLGAADFPADQKGGYIKLMLRPDGAEAKPTVRTYTIRDQRMAEIDVDFALHLDEAQSAGPATAWALSARAGDTIEVGGPGPARRLPDGFGSYLIAGDMTALPAIAANLEALPSDATGFVALEIQDEKDRQDLAAPAGVHIEWLVNPRPGAVPDLLADTLRAHPWPQGSAYAWAACEFSSMKRLRAYLRGERHLGPDQLYLSSYWKSGLDEDAHRVAKRADSGPGQS